MLVLNEDIEKELRSGYALAEDFIERYSHSYDADKTYINIDQIIQSWGITRKDVELEDKNLTAD